MDNLFSNKRTYKTDKGEELIDMCIPSLRLKDLKANAYIRVDSSCNGRLDRFVYTNVSRDLDNGIDATMYINHIFNPFAVQEGDVLFTPVENSASFEQQDEPKLPDGTSMSSRASETKQMTYAERVEYLAKLGFGINIS